MHRRAILRASAAAALAIGFSRLGDLPARARQATDLASLGLPELTITVTEAGYEVSPATTPSGWTLVTFENQSPGDNSADVMLLPPGETMESLMTALAEAMASPTAAPPAWIYQAIFAGAPWTPAGTSAQAVVHLAAGEWVVFSPAALTPATLTVTAESATPTAPLGLQADREVSMQEYAFVGLEAPVASGPQIWKVTNSGQQPHFVTVSQLPPGTTQAQYMDGTMDMMSGTPEAEGLDLDSLGLVGGCSTLSGGESLYLQLDLEAGTYGAICFFPEPETGAPHALMGMAQVFTVM